MAARPRRRDPDGPRNAGPGRRRGDPRDTPGPWRASPVDHRRERASRGGAARVLAGRRHGRLSREAAAEGSAGTGHPRGERRRVTPGNRQRYISRTPRPNVRNPADSATRPTPQATSAVGADVALASEPTARPPSGRPPRKATMKMLMTRPRISSGAASWAREIAVDVTMISATLVTSSRG